MKLILTSIIFIFPLIIFCQDTTYFDFYGNKVSSLNDAYEFKIICLINNDTNYITEKFYSSEGKIKREISYYVDYKEKKMHGARKEWYQNGQIRFDIKYDKGYPNGKFLTYWENGMLKREDIYENGTMLSGKCLDSTGKEVKHFEFEVSPEFPNGLNALYQFLAKKLNYPINARENGIQGTVYVSFYVEKIGDISNIKIQSGVTKELDDEAIRVVKMMPYWKPGMIDGEIERVKLVLPLSFRVN